MATLIEELNALGTEGWEAFAFDVYHAIFYLKRMTG